MFVNFVLPNEYGIPILSQTIIYPMLLPIFFLVGGFAALIIGANMLISGASSLARKMRISDLAIGLTIVAFGTSAPEFVVNIVASTQGLPDIVLGNVIGSNLFNLFLILGLAGIISPLLVQSSSVWKEIPISFFAIVVLLILANFSLYQADTRLDRTDGIILLALFAGFLYYVFRQFKSDPSTIDTQEKTLSSPKTIIYIIAGLAGLVLGGRLSIMGAVSLAEQFGLSERVIGLTIIAAGTSLPELATSVVAAIRKNNDIAMGNIIGSNIFNIFFILGSSAIINPIPYNSAYNVELYLLGLGTIFLFVAMFSGKQKMLDRWEAALLIGAYVAYTIWLL
jgi:cation:H+ antiporter